MGHSEQWEKRERKRIYLGEEDRADKLSADAAARVTSYEMQFACDRDSRGARTARCIARVALRFA